MFATHRLNFTKNRKHNHSHQTESCTILVVGVIEEKYKGWGWGREGTEGGMGTIKIEYCWGLALWCSRCVCLSWLQYSWVYGWGMGEWGGYEMSCEQRHLPHLVVRVRWLVGSPLQSC